MSQRAQAKLYNARIKRWKGISATPKSLRNLYTPLTTLMNGILTECGITRQTRLFLNTHDVSIGGNIELDFSPPIYLTGTGTEFVTTRAATPRAFYVSGISAVEVCLDSQNQVKARDRLAVHMHQIFQHQDNRRFAYGLVITENMVTVYMFDHAGAVATSPFDYHQDPKQFVALVIGLASDGDRIGFDRSICREGNSAVLHTSASDHKKRKTSEGYIVREKLFHFPHVLGRGTICWLTSRLGDPEKRYVVKDAWIAPENVEGKESEGYLLRYAQEKGIRSGIAQVHNFEEIRCGNGSLDTVLRNRKVEATSIDDMILDRAHTRIVMTTHGKTLDKFANRRELLLAFHDAVSAHRHLYEEAGILHRDISVRNILINPHGVEGDRGILIDFDHAIRIWDNSPYSKKPKIGTWRYMSRNVLDAKGPHTYLDDLESFFYVLYWIVVAYDGPGADKAALPLHLVWWDEPGSVLFKYALIGQDFECTCAPWFGKSIHNLAFRLHKFIRTKAVGQPASALNSLKDYDEFLGHVKQSIADLDQETDPVLSVPCCEHSAAKPVRSVVPGLQKRNRDQESAGYAETSSPRPVRRIRTLRHPAPPTSTERPRRSTANYGD